MEASSAKTNNGRCKMLTFTLALVASLMSIGVSAQEEEVIAVTSPNLESYVRGDMIPRTTKSTETEGEQGQVWDIPTMGSPQTTAAAATTDDVDNQTSTPADQDLQTTAGANTKDMMESKTPAPLPSRGDGPDNNLKPMPKDDVVCVSKEDVQDKNAVSLKLKEISSCKDTKKKIESVIQDLCGEDCKLEIYQEDNSDQLIVSGKYVEDDVAGMTNKFNNDNIRDKTDVEEATPRWGKNSKVVLVSLLLTGLLLAALLVAGYYFKTHRKNSKGVRLAESFQVDEENQANTLVSVAPLPQQEVLDKPTPNGESPPENGTNQSPTTNGHSQTPVADTEM